MEYIDSERWKIGRSFWDFMNSPDSVIGYEQGKETGFSVLRTLNSRVISLSSSMPVPGW